MGEIANDIVNGACCALCGCFFVEKKVDPEWEPPSFFEHGYPAACTDCYEEDCGYQLQNSECDP